MTQVVVVEEAETVGVVLMADRPTAGEWALANSAVLDLEFGKGVCSRGPAGGRHHRAVLKQQKGF